jgi:hypothetical protein
VKPDRDLLRIFIMLEFPPFIGCRRGGDERKPPPALACRRRPDDSVAAELPSACAYQL